MRPRKPAVIETADDLHGSADYKRHIAVVLLRRSSPLLYRKPCLGKCSMTAHTDIPRVRSASPSTAKPGEARDRAARAADRRSARSLRTEGHQAVLRRPGLRRLHRAARRPPGQQLLDAGRRCRRARRAQTIEGVAQRRRARPGAARIRRSRRATVRLLHARLRTGGQGAAGAQSRRRPRRRSDASCAATSAVAPATSKFSKR